MSHRKQQKVVVNSYLLSNLYLALVEFKTIKGLQRMLKSEPVAHFIAFDRARSAFEGPQRALK